MGVLHRVLELADRDVPWYPEGQADFVSLIPLVEVLSEILGVGPGSKTVLKEYQRLIGHFGSEFSLLLDASLDEIAGLGSPLLSEAVHRIRAKNVIRRPGYDGHYGTIRVFQDGELNRFL